MDFWAIFDFWRNQDFFEKIKIHVLAITFYPDIQITWFLHRWVSFLFIFPGIPIKAMVMVIKLMAKYGQYGHIWVKWPYMPYIDHFYFFNFKSWRNKSGVRIWILLLKSGFLGTFWNFDFSQTSVPKWNYRH